MNQRSIQKLFGPALCVLLLSYGFNTQAAQPELGPNSGDDTILVEYAPNGKSAKMSYSAMLKRLASSLIGIDLESTTTFGENRKDSVIKGFADLKARMHYRFDANGDEVKFRINLNL